MVPNFLSAFRLISGFPIMVLYNAGLYPYSLSLLFLASVSDFFDGYIARKWKQTSFFGAIFDAAADKVLIGSLFVYFFYKGKLPFWFISVSLFRDIAISVGSVLFFSKLKKQPHVLVISKINTTLQLVLLVMIIFAKAFHVDLPNIIFILIILSFSLTLVSGVLYFIFFIKAHYES